MRRMDAYNDTTYIKNAKYYIAMQCGCARECDSGPCQAKSKSARIEDG